MENTRVALNTGDLARSGIRTAPLFCHNLILVLEPLWLTESIAAGTP